MLCCHRDVLPFPKTSLSLSYRTLVFAIARIYPVLLEFVLSVCESTIILLFEFQCAS